MTDGDAGEAEGSREDLLLARQLHQRLDALHRAGVDRIPFVAADGIELARNPSRVGKAEVQRIPSGGAEAAGPPPAPPPKTPAQPEPEILKRPAARKPAPEKPASPAHAPAAGALFGDAGFDTPTVPAADRPGQLLEIAQVVSTCPKCPILVATRNKTVFGDGSPTARLMFIGEAPGAEEDKRGIPFVGRAGQLLTDMITKGMGLRREDVYIANILKCRPPENRDPAPDECANCMPYLERQLEIIRPEFLCLLGRVAAQNLLQTTVAMGKLRGRWHSVRGIKALVTYHPSYLLRNPPAKKDAWEDLQIIMKEMGIAVPGRKKE